MVLIVIKVFGITGLIKQKIIALVKRQEINLKNTLILIKKENKICSLQCEMYWVNSFFMLRVLLKNLKIKNH